MSENGGKFPFHFGSNTVIVAHGLIVIVIVISWESVLLVWGWRSVMPTEKLPVHTCHDLLQVTDNFDHIKVLSSTPRQ